MFDVERLTNEEREEFEHQYGEMVIQMMEEIARLPPKSEFEDQHEYFSTEHHYKINYRIFDFEAVFNLRVNLMEYLRNRDMQWVPQMMP